jgi:endonuclease III
MIPMPFVTETTKVFLILPIHSDEQSIAIRFLRHVNKTLFERETRDKFELLLTHIVSTKQEYSQTQKWFDQLRHEVDLIRQLRTQLTIIINSTLRSTNLFIGLFSNKTSY